MPDLTQGVPVAVVSVVAGGTQVGSAVGSGFGGAVGSQGGSVVDVSDGDVDGVAVSVPEVSAVLGGGSEGAGSVGVGSGVEDVVEPELVDPESVEPELVDPELLVGVSELVGAGSDEEDGAVLVVSGVAFGLEGVEDVGDDAPVPGTAAPGVDDGVPEAVGVTAPGTAGGEALAAAAAA